MSILEQIDKERLPQHIAIIMDGNGRWAKQRGLDRSEGHRAGQETVRHMIQTSARMQISYLTLYAFSTENWNRPPEEVKALMSLMIQAIANETAELVKNNVKVLVIGDTARLPLDTQQALKESLEATSQNTGLTVVIALSYSSKWELAKVTQEIALDVKLGKLRAEDITESTIDNYLTTKGIPDPDILIRTGGEQRISNFLLWQIAYSELYFTDQLWPDFDAESLYEAVLDFQNRERRFGKTSEQISGQQ